MCEYEPKRGSFDEWDAFFFWLYTVLGFFNEHNHFVKYFFNLHLKKNSMHTEKPENKNFRTYGVFHLWTLILFKVFLSLNMLFYIVIWDYKPNKN